MMMEMMAAMAKLGDFLLIYSIDDGKMGNRDAEAGCQLTLR